MTDFTTKQCTSCKYYYPATNEFFPKNKSSADGLFSWCKRCKKDHDREYRNSPKGKNTRSKNRKTEKAKASQRIRSHRFSQTEKGRRRAIQSAKQAREKHPERYKARKEVYKAIQRKEIPPAKECLCVECGLKAMHYHHFKGYDSAHWFDVVPLCRNCHKREHNK